MIAADLSESTPLSPQVMFKANIQIYKKHQKAWFVEVWPYVCEKENTTKRTGWIEAWWMNFSFWLSIYDSWFAWESKIRRLKIKDTKAKYKDHSKGDVFETSRPSSCARTSQENCMFSMKAKHEGCWLRHCLSLQMFAADLSELAKCAVPSGLSHRLCCNNRAVRICVAQWHCIRIFESITGNLSSSTM